MSAPTHVKESRFVKLEQATKNLFCSSIRKKSWTVPNVASSIQCGLIGVLVPQDQQSGTTHVSVGSSTIPVWVGLSFKDLPTLLLIIPQKPVAPSAIEPYSNEDLTPLESIALQSTSTPSTSDSTPKAAAAPVLLTAASGDRVKFSFKISTHLHLRFLCRLLVSALRPPCSWPTTTYCSALIWYLSWLLQASQPVWIHPSRRQSTPFFRIRKSRAKSASWPSGL
ncbi:MAG: hypothetical protein J3R72DRAFT_447257 [Linnemannia gamsii]|nr:MAG: hypothetical protein J3R72DRAFT_447257 [Linnemannia gamsii]